MTNKGVGMFLGERILVGFWVSGQNLMRPLSIVCCVHDGNLEATRAWQQHLASRPPNKLIQPENWPIYGHTHTQIFLGLRVANLGQFELRASSRKQKGLCHLSQATIVLNIFCSPGFLYSCQLDCCCLLNSEQVSFLVSHTCTSHTLEECWVSSRPWGKNRKMFLSEKTLTWYANLQKCRTWWTV